MGLISRILVPVVFSDRCRDATRYAAALACRFQCEMTLLHVFVQPWAAYSSPEGYATPPPYDLESTLAQLQEQLDQFLDKDLRKLSVKHVLAEGDPATVIERYACSNHCDLIVMPTHGYGPFRRFLLGSVTAKVLHDLDCPVWTGPHLERPPALESPCFAKILCALDLQPENRGVLEWASRFAAEFGSELAIVHSLPISSTRMEGLYFDASWRDHMAADVRRQLGALQKELHIEGEILIEVGDVPGAIGAAAEATGADLVVIGRGHPRGVMGRLRNHAYGIVREAPCPVVAI